MNDFIKQQQELGKKHTCGVENDREGNLTYFIESKDLDTLITQTIANTGEELLRLLNGEETETYQETEGGWCGEETVSLDTLKKHITSVTGVE